MGFGAFAGGLSAGYERAKKKTAAKPVKPVTPVPGTATPTAPDATTETTPPYITSGNPEGLDEMGDFLTIRGG